MVSLSGSHLLVVAGLFAAGVSHAEQALAFELVEADAVLGVGEVDVEDGPDEREAAGLAREAADRFGAAFDLGARGPALAIRRRQAPRRLLRHRREANASPGSAPPSDSQLRLDCDTDPAASPGAVLSAMR